MSIIQLYTLTSYNTLVSHFGYTSANLRALGALLVLAFLLFSVYALGHAIYGVCSKQLSTNN